MIDSLGNFKLKETRFSVYFSVIICPKSHELMQFRQESKSFMVTKKKVVMLRSYNIHSGAKTTTTTTQVCT